MMYQLQELMQFMARAPHNTALYDSFEVEVKQVWPWKSGEHATYGPWSIQGCDTVEGIKIKFDKCPDVSGIIAPGTRLTIDLSEYKGKRVGVKVVHDKRDPLKREISVGKSAKIVSSDGRDIAAMIRSMAYGKSAPSASQAPAQMVQPAQVQSPEAMFQSMLPMIEALVESMLKARGIPTPVPVQTIKPQAPVVSAATLSSAAGYTEAPPEDDLPF